MTNHRNNKQLTPIAHTATRVKPCHNIKESNTQLHFVLKTQKMEGLKSPYLRT